MKKITPIYYYLPGVTEPTLAGYFEWDGGQGKFTYDKSYLQDINNPPVAISPVSLPLKTRKNIEQDFNGIFGIFSDASADAWGKRQLESIHGELDDFDLLIKSKDDGVGAIVIGDSDDKKSVSFSVEDLIFAAKNIESFQFNDVPIDLVSKLSPTTSMGGIKPKINVEYQKSMWLAKLTERGDSIYLPHAESAMLKMGAKCGIRTCESEVKQINEHQYAILVKRFDRELIKEGQNYARKGYASAHTVLRIKPSSGLKEKSYIRFAEALSNWTGAKNFSNPSFNGFNQFALNEEKRELWRRLVFNALVGNADDHAKNHGLLQQGDRWALSPAFDIVPFQYRRQSLALSMSFSEKDGRATSVVSLESLLSHVKKFAYHEDESREAVLNMSTYIHANWRAYMMAEGMPESATEIFAHSFSFASLLNNVKSHPSQDHQSLLENNILAK